MDACNAKLIDTWKNKLITKKTPTVRRAINWIVQWMLAVCMCSKSERILLIIYRFYWTFIINLLTNSTLWSHIPIALIYRALALRMHSLNQADALNSNMCTNTCLHVEHARFRSEKPWMKFVAILCECVCAGAYILFMFFPQEVEFPSERNEQE